MERRFYGKLGLYPELAWEWDNDWKGHRKEACDYALTGVDARKIGKSEEIVYDVSCMHKTELCGALSSVKLEDIAVPTHTHTPASLKWEIASALLHDLVYEVVEPRLKPIPKLFTPFWDEEKIAADFKRDTQCKYGRSYAQWYLRTRVGKPHSFWRSASIDSFLERARANSRCLDSSVGKLWSAPEWRPAHAGGYPTPARATLGALLVLARART